MGKSTINGPFSDNSYVELPEGTSQVLVVSQLPKIKRCSDLHPKITKLDRNVIFQTHESGVLCWIKGVCNLRQPNLAMNKKTTDDVPIKEMAVHKGWKKTRSIRDFTLHITFFFETPFSNHFPICFFTRHFWMTKSVIFPWNFRHHFSSGSSPGPYAPVAGYIPRAGWRSRTRWEGKPWLKSHGFMMGLWLINGFMMDELMINYKSWIKLMGLSWV